MVDMALPRMGCCLMPDWSFIGCHECSQLFVVVDGDIKMCWGVTFDRPKVLFARIKKMYKVVSVDENCVVTFEVGGRRLEDRVDVYYDRYGIKKVRPVSDVKRWYSGGVVRGEQSHMVSSPTSQKCDAGSILAPANKSRAVWGRLKVAGKSCEE